ncbi:MAG: hypothetical protein ACP5QJ_07730, partial [Thermosulfidibacteraceae bacterium]
ITLGQILLVSSLLLIQSIPHQVQSLSVWHCFISGIGGSGLGIGAIVVGGIKGPTSQRLLTHLQADPGLGITWGQALPLISSLLTQLIPHQVQSLSVWHCFISGIGGFGSVIGIGGFGLGIGAIVVEAAKAEKAKTKPKAMLKNKYFFIFIKFYLF